ncbi:LysR family transcriptional regulator [Nitrospirillum sp. BR 11163]|uniref:LysR family transcriptional regulator n=1 Tax=Nitrospirillum sp. BR 11163 TaxID=3104323 RepID=UPI002AFFAB2C|nr:LysR family transcriptional regulator [Nitrospirillum sp. BR 11163]MEA1676806.1 LysR family transcriptional regulator [Nitrospirillum sp. BR 11163]
MADQIRTAPDWEDVRVFIALARHGSLSAAARALSVNHATVARRVAALEQALGERLVERRPDGYALSQAGQRALIAATDMETAAATLGRGDAEAGPRGLVRINTTPGLAQGFLVDRLASLPARYTSLDVEVAANIRAVSLERRETDIALRLARPQDGDVIARPMVAVAFGFYATEDWCRRLAEGAPPTFVGFDETNRHLPEALWLARHFPRARVAVRVGNQFAQAAAARAGAGIALLPHVNGRMAPGLVLCPLGPPPPARTLWLVTRRQDDREPAIRTVTDFLINLFKEEQALFED